MDDMASLVIDSPIGPLGLVATDEGLAGVTFHARGFPSEGRSAVLAEAAAQLQSYFSGELTSFELALDLRGSDFQRRCWLALATIPYGQTVSYGEQARRLEHELAHAEAWAIDHPGADTIRQLVNASAALDDLLEELAARTTQYPALLPESE